MLGTLLLGLLLGLQHALEADHLAAVVSLSAGAGSLRDAARQGAAWGVGHSLSLLAFGGCLLWAGQALPRWTSNALELLVGITLVLLGADVLRRLWRQRIHVHAHRHGAQRHVHAHSHVSGVVHRFDPHDHPHAATLPKRALLVGMVHGLAGTAALLVFALGSLQSGWHGLVYLGLFGIGSIIGMTALSVVISLPLRWSARRLTWACNGMTGLFGAMSIAIGLVVLERSGRALIGSSLSL